MNNQQTRILLFLSLCIPIRLLFVWLAKTMDPQYLMFMAIGAFIIAMGFFRIYFTKSRPIGIETLGAPIWWNALRPVHGLLYLLFAIFAFHQYDNAWIFLGIDVVIGLLSFLVHHFK